MIFETDADLYALTLPADTPQARQDMAFHLLTCYVSEIKAHFVATFQKIEVLRACGYSPEKIAPYERALIEILIELRIRGYESDYTGNIYKSSSLIPIPESHNFSRQRQKHHIATMEPELLRIIYGKTLQKLQTQAKKESKASQSS